MKLGTISAIIINLWTANCLPVVTTNGLAIPHRHLIARQGPLMELGELAEITGHEEALELGKKFGERELDKEVEKRKQANAKAAEQAAANTQALAQMKDQALQTQGPPSLEDSTGAHAPPARPSATTVVQNPYPLRGQTVDTVGLGDGSGKRSQKGILAKATESNGGACREPLECADGTKRHAVETGQSNKHVYSRAPSE
ncbi:hypothetical protein FRB95_005450 [Tulasnella sp. JGI-2019a]|nr:hypothetical protein FRB95_005450 [Tulasnella sp. JGI-2019a]